MRVLLVTTWNTACGIAECGAMIKQAVEQADPEITIEPRPDGLDPRALITRPSDIVHLNYHMSLHSRWGADEVRALQDRGVRTIVTFHDTLGEFTPAELRATGDTRLDRLEALAEVADALVVHEPCAGFPDAHAWRMGVSAPQVPYQYAARRPRTTAWQPTMTDACFKAWDAQPVLGSIGFPLPWKNFDRLAEITKEIGWALLLIAPTATKEQVAEWYRLNPALHVRTDFVGRQEAIALLAGCDATAFPYTCGNTGQSGAILQGIAARKPVIALRTCRQFRALYDDSLGRNTIDWVEDFNELNFALQDLHLGRCDPGIVALAEQESWEKVGARYATLYRSLA